ncbi:DUF3459 domain-containing protein [Agrobacterium tumefaciens]|uniref:DUF3459 domain-containing protein n=1 Tax=Agrobacterium tumefaciens TaxID=358 RepID=UPI002FDAB7E8
MDAGRVVEAGDGCVAVTWTFSAGALSIAVNLGDETSRTSPETRFSRGQDSMTPYLKTQSWFASPQRRYNENPYSNLSPAIPKWHDLAALKEK